MAGDDAITIKNIITGIFRAFEDHSPGGIEGHMDESATLWDVFTPQLIRGKTDREKFHAADQAQMQARGPLTLRIDDPVVTVWDDAAIARYYISFDYKPPNPASGRARITTIFRKRGDTWKIVHHHEGLVPSGMPELRE